MYARPFILAHMHWLGSVWMNSDTMQILFVLTIMYSKIRINHYTVD